MTLGVQVFDTTNTLVAEYTTIQTAIDSLTTLDGFTVRVIEEDYSPGEPEVVTVTKQLIIETNTNAGINPNTDVRGEEVVVDRFDVRAPYVVIDGFTISGSSDDPRVQGFDLENIALTDSIVIQNGQHFAVAVSAGPTGAHISNNAITANSIGGVHVNMSGHIAGNVITTYGYGIYFRGLNWDFSAAYNTITSLTHREFPGIVVENPGDSNGIITGNDITVGDVNSAIVLFGRIDAGSNISVRDNVAFNGGRFGVVVDPTNNANTPNVILADDLLIFSGQSEALIALSPQAVSNNITVEEASLIHTVSMFALTDAFDGPTDGYHTIGTAYLPDLQSAINHSFDFATITLSANYNNAVDITVSCEELTIDAPAATITGTLTLNPGIQNITLQGVGNIDVIGNAEDNRIKGNDGANVINSGTGDDLIFGNGGDDIIDGGADNDEVLGGGDNDMLFGNEGNDTLSGGGGDDTADGGDNDDLVLGAAGNDTVLGGDGADTVSGGLGIDIVDGGAGNDMVFGADGNDTSVSGGADNDTVSGGTGNDNVFGDSGDDSVLGASGDDRLDGGTGIDILSGGSGFDTLIFGLGYEADTVQGFEDDIDTLEFNDDLWGGGLTAQQVVDTFATQFSPGIVDFDFGGGDTLRVIQGSGITTNDLVNDIMIV